MMSFNWRGADTTPVRNLVRSAAPPQLWPLPSGPLGCELLACPREPPALGVLGVPEDLTAGTGSVSPPPGGTLRQFPLCSPGGAQPALPRAWFLWAPRTDPSMPSTSRVASGQAVPSARGWWPSGVPFGGRKAPALSHRPCPRGRQQRFPAVGFRRVRSPAGGLGPPDHPCAWRCSLGSLGRAHHPSPRARETQGSAHHPLPLSATSWPSE